MVHRTTTTPPITVTFDDREFVTHVQIGDVLHLLTDDAQTAFMAMLREVLDTYDDALLFEGDADFVDLPL